MNTSSQELARGSAGEDGDGGCRAWLKTDIINHLARTRGYRRYLEICTTMTGKEFARIDRSQFSTCHRLMYRCPEDFTDGMAINFRATGLAVDECVRDMRLQGAEYDIILVDSWHEYEPSYRDLQIALGLLDDAGTIVVHDCLPSSADFIGATWQAGCWCGVSFIAFLDFVQKVRGLEYLTIDTDFGCGLIRKTSHETAPDAGIKQRWESVRHDAQAAFRFMTANKGPLLNLLSVAEFKNLNRAAVADQALGGR